MNIKYILFAMVIFIVSLVVFTAYLTYLNINNEPPLVEEIIE